LRSLSYRYRFGNADIGSGGRNGQPAAAMYMRAGRVHVPFQLHVLDMRSDGVSHVVAFLDETLFPKFGLPSSL